MALFLVPRYGSDGSGDQIGAEMRSQDLLRRLQERARIRECQKTVPTWPGCLEGEISDDETGSKEASGKKRQRGDSDFGNRRKKWCDNLNEEEEPGSGNEQDAGSEFDKDNAGEMPEAEDPSAPPPSPNPAPPPPSAVLLGHDGQKAARKVRPVLPPWLAQPRQIPQTIKENLVPLVNVPKIHPRLVRKLRANGIDSLFPVQAEVIPAILAGGSGGFMAGRGGVPPSDFCVSAPTGSGKTLAFVLPVIQALLDRVVCHVRALVVLPTKELAQQVSKVFNVYADGTGLKVVQISGQKSFAKEQDLLVEKTLTGFRSLADIVVATPGRLVDHLQRTPQFNLGQLRFLVIDEADRMMDGMHQDWLPQVEEAALRVRGGTQWGVPTAAGASIPRLPLQKLLFSATLTRDMEKLQPLRLFRPRLFAPHGGPAPAQEEDQEEEEEEEEGQRKYTLPEGLSHFFVPCGLRWKPLFLLDFLLRLRFSRVLCFANSREASHRLFLLIRAFGGVGVAEFSSRLTPAQRKGALKDFERGKIQLLISTDATARGIDIPGVKCVISYDAPQFIRTYIHRVGRTARAGMAGLAFTLLLKQQESRFLGMLGAAGLPPIERQLVSSRHLRPLLPQYEAALAELREAVKEEQEEKRS